MKPYLLFLIAFLFLISSNAQKLKIEEIEAHLNKFSREYNYQVVDQNFGTEINLDSIATLLSKEYVFANENYSLDRDHINVYSNQELINYVRQNENYTDQFKIFLSYILPTKLESKEKQKIFNAIKYGLDPNLISIVESIISLKPLSKEQVLEFDWLNERLRLNSLLLFHLYISAHIEKESTVELLRSIESETMYFEYIKWIRSNLGNQTIILKPKLCKELAKIAISTKKTEHLKYYIYLIDRFEEKHHQHFMLNGLNIIHKMPHSWGSKEQLLVQDYAYLYPIQNNFSSIVEVFSRLKMSESKLYFIDGLADNFNVTDDQLDYLLDLYLKDHLNSFTSISSNGFLYLNIEQENNKVQGVNLEKRNPEYLYLFRDYLEKNMLTTNSNPIDFKEFNAGIGVSSKVYALYYLLGKHGRAFQLNKEFNQDSFEEHNSLVHDFNNIIKTKLAKLGITTSNMFIVATNDRKYIKLGVLTADKKISFRIQKDIKRFNSVLMDFTNQLLRHYDLDDRALLINELVYEIEHYAIMPPEKLEQMLAFFPELGKL